MFSQPARSNRKWATSQVISFAIHCVVIYALVRPVAPIFVTPSSVMRGEHGTSMDLVYLRQRGIDSSMLAQADDRSLSLRRPAQVKPKPRSAVARTAKATAGNSLQAPRAGTPYGSLLAGPTDGREIKPALPVIFPDPAVARGDIPAGVEGNVIVEITIDVQGNVVGTKVLQALGHGIEDKVLAALRNWRFRPATMDGVPIPSQQDVYFHFPS